MLEWHTEDENTDIRVLICLLKHPRDWEIVREQQWYRIPTAHAPLPLCADALAFYQPGRFGAERWQVAWLAPVVRYGLALRRDLLPGEARHRRANEAYFVIHLGALESLTFAIPAAKLRRVTFIPTTLQRLQTARDVRDLWYTPEFSGGNQADVWGAGLARRSLREEGE